MPTHPSTHPPTEQRAAKNTPTYPPTPTHPPARQRAASCMTFECGKSE